MGAPLNHGAERFCDTLEDWLSMMADNLLRVELVPLGDLPQGLDLPAGAPGHRR